MENNLNYSFSLDPDLNRMEKFQILDPYNNLYGSASLNNVHWTYFRSHLCVGVVLRMFIRMSAGELDSLYNEVYLCEQSYIYKVQAAPSYHTLMSTSAPFICVKIVCIRIQVEEQNSVGR